MYKDNGPFLILLAKYFASSNIENISDNYKGFTKNVFGSGGVINVLFMSPKTKVNFQYLEEVIGPEDTYKQMYERASRSQNAAKKLL